MLADPPPLVFSALPSAVAGPVELALARQGCHVFSNAAAHRLDPDVPLLIPEVNPGHIEALARQRQAHGYQGSLVTNPNCSAVGLLLGLHPWVARFGVRRIHVCTYQALSGAGLTGVAALAIHGNVIPHIAEEEEKVAREAAKILGKWDGSAFRPAAAPVHASCVRVGVSHGHLLAVHVELVAAVTAAELRAAVEAYVPAYGALVLPTAPERAVVWDERGDAPQPARDLEPMAVRIGRVRHDGEVTRAFLLAHNLVRGSAGGSVLNAELALATGAIA